MAACALWLLGALSTHAAGLASGETIAATPPMGWNSWDSYGLRITEQQFRDNAAVLAAKLKPYGFTYAVIDEGWYMANPEDRPRPELLKYELDANGRFIPVIARFPSALQNGNNTGFAQLGHWVHSIGLQFGIHIIRGIPRETVARNLPIEGSNFRAQDAADRDDPCPWDPTSWGIRDNAAGQAWYDALFRQYAAWGVDFVKVDCIADHPYKPTEIRQIATAIKHSGRDMVLSLSPGPTAVAHQAEVAEWAQMWRMSDDVWDLWDKGAQPWPIGVRNQFDNAARWAQYSRPGHWPDADMLPIGELSPYPDVGPQARHTRLTSDELRTLLSLWAMARSPLILGANLVQLDEDTLRLVANPDILAIDQSALASRQVLRDGALVVWTADLLDGRRALAAFNIGEQAILANCSLASVGLAGYRLLKNAWTGERLHDTAQVTATLAAHASAVLILERN